MYVLLVSLVLGLFAAMLFLNIYFRVKVLKAYRVLVENQVEFGAAHVFNQRRLTTEVLPKYPPPVQEAIQAFSSHLRYSVRMATVLVALITLFGGILMYYGRG